MSETQRLQGPQPWLRRGQAISWSRVAGVIALAAAVIGVVAVLLLALGSARPVAAASVRGILAEPDSYVGQRVAVSGQVGQLLTHRALTLDADQPQGSLLVVVEQSALAGAYDTDAAWGYVPQPHGPLYTPGYQVQLIGTIEQFDRVALTDRLSMVFNADLFGRFEDQPVLLVEQLDLTAPDGTELVARG